MDDEALKIVFLLSILTFVIGAFTSTIPIVIILNIIMTLVAGIFIISV